MWIFPDATGGTSRGLMSRGTGVSAWEFYRQGSDGACILYMGFGYITASIIPTGVWSNVGFRYNDTDLDIFVNGVLTNSTRTRTANVASNYVARAFSPARYYGGLMSQVCAWTRKITDAEIAELYNGGAGTNFLDL
jgi:hypothetical protein